MGCVQIELAALFAYPWRINAPQSSFISVMPQTDHQPAPARSILFIQYANRTSIAVCKKHSGEPWQVESFRRRAGCQGQHRRGIDAGRAVPQIKGANQTGI